MSARILVKPRLAFWVTALGRCRRVAPGITVALLGLIVVENAAVALLGLSVRALTESAAGRDFAHVALAAASAAVCVLLITVGKSMRQSFRGNLSERAGVTLDQEILELVAGLRRLEHIERPEYLDRVSLVLGSGPALISAAWLPIEAAGSVVGLASSVALLVQIHPALLALLLATPVPLLVNRRAQQRMSAAFLASAESARLEEHLFGLLTASDPVKEIAVCAATDRLTALRREAWRRTYAIQIGARLRAALWMSLGWSLFTAVYVCGLAYVAYLAAHGLRSAGEMLMAITLAGQLRTQVQETIEGVGSAVGGAEALDPYLWLVEYHTAHAADDVHEQAGKHPPDCLRHGISLRGLTFRYPHADRDAVHRVTAHLPAGATVAVVGEYGSGKTSLVKLLCGFYQPASGDIQVDGVDLRELAPSAWSGRLAVAFQDFGRYHAPLREIVGIGDLPRSRDPRAMAQALSDGDAVGVVEHLDGGLETLLGKEFGGVELSEGQWQRLAIARSAMRANPLLLILDEPTAALDAPSERAMFRRHRAIARRLAASYGTVTVIVSHRMSSVRDADLVLVLDGGRLCEAGTHAELIQRDGRYAELMAIHEELHTASGERAH